MSCCLSGCWRNSCIGACPSPPLWMKLLSTFWIELLRTLWVGLHSTLWIELLSPLWEELLSRATGLAGLPRTQETKGPQQWGEGRGPLEHRRPCCRSWGGLCSLPGQAGCPGEHPLTSLGRTAQQGNRASWSSQDSGDKGPAAVGGGEGSLGTGRPCCRS